MIHIDILGCGEAFDPDRANSSVLVTAGDFRLLIDCGMGVAQAVWQRSDEGDFIDAVYFTHLHVDHCGGLPALLDHMGAKGRTKPLDIYGPDDALDRIEAAILFAAWPGTTPDFPVKVRAKSQHPQIGPMSARYAQTEHSATNHAIRLEYEGASFFYSGDGRPTIASRALMTGAKVAFHETQAVRGSDPVPGHCDFDTVRGLVDEQGIGAMWLYHTAGRSDAAFAERLREVEDSRLSYAKAGVSFAVT